MKAVAIILSLVAGIFATVALAQENAPAIYPATGQAINCVYLPAGTSYQIAANYEGVVRCDQYGQLIISNPGSGGSTASQTASNASDGQATSNTNQQAVVFPYVFNGTTWDRVRGTNGALNVSAAQPSGTTYAVTWTGQTVAATQSGTWNVSVNNFPTTQTVAQPDARATGQALASGTANAAVTVATNNGEGVVGWTVTGLTASGAVLTPEGSNDGGTTWSSINAVVPGSGTQLATLTADGQYRVNAGGHTNVRLRVSTTGTGNITVAYTASSVSSLVALSSPAPILGAVGGQPVNVQPPAILPVRTLVSVAASSTTLVPAKANRRAVQISCDGTSTVGVSQTGATLTANTLAGGADTIIPASAANAYIPPFATTSAITAYGTSTAQNCVATEWIAP